MTDMAEFIWIDEKKYPEYQKSAENAKYGIVRFTNDFSLPGVDKIKVKIYADAKYTLYVNGQFIGVGPASAGGDYVFKKMTYCFFDEYEIPVPNGKINIIADVTTVSTALEEIVFDNCCFFLYASDFSGNELFGTDSNWKAQLLAQRKELNFTDYTAVEEPILNAIVSLKAAKSHNMLPKQTENLEYKTVYPTKFEKITVEPQKSVDLCLDFDKIYAAYPTISVNAQGKVILSCETSEIDGVGVFCEDIVTDKSVTHFSPRMRSIGQIKIKLKNESDKPATIDNVYITAVSYPVKNETGFECSDKLINKIYDVCMHTLKICRQSIHLDSPKHREPLACTGDYFIENLMECMNIYDLTLTKSDIFKTSQFIELQNGAMFHTTYSLIYPEWVYDCYMYSDDQKILVTAQKSLYALINKFDTYFSSDGLIEKAPNYMFVDWIDIDEFNLHHPPKALGQSVLCMFYYNALNVINKIFFC